ncbi:carboxylesterase [Bacillus sp. AGMB 02131]|uniref:Carboxylesterase n=1 Tax=Peribacillus faecalis TaxID=2772559 RepID=A0A927CZL1_9BACI|nr:carboxylesterase [Peribacillus faecalis]MBD3108269.1 carboxylesterase [Peribacillus faecalis]
MRIVAPKPFLFEAGKRAVLLLHGFTGNSSDVRMLGRYLQDQGYTCHAPIYKGHGVPPEELVTTGPRDWWKDVLMGYDLLRSKGYEQIAVAGLSLGGVFSLKAGYTLPVKGIITMCAPMSFKSADVMNEGVLKYAREYKKREGKNSELIEREMDRLEPMQTLEALHGLVAGVSESLPRIQAPTFVVQARQDDVINPDSAEFIYNEIKESNKQLKWYEKSGHVITLDKEKQQLHEDVHRFLEQLNWKD